ncbi:acetate/propionate family kinase [Candidatus Omnitrophota bacterium]
MKKNRHLEILVLNSGSSSIKYQLFLMPQEKILDKGSIDNIGESGSKIKNHQQALMMILSKISHIDAVGHRVVHGADRFKAPVRINSSVIKKIKQCIRLAPLHNPANLAGITCCTRMLKNIPQVAVFDTAFHQTMPRHAYMYGLPYRFYKRHHVRRYGFHGTSHEFVSEEAAKRLKRPLKKLRLITCHLGSGCSMSAVRFGRCVDTSMGLTPLEGLLMGTRTGDMDPAIVTFLQKHLDISPTKMDEILNRESGLKGVTGISNDMRKITAASRSNARARLALEMFIYRIRKYIGSYISVLGGADAVIFTAGISEHQPRILKRINQGLFVHLKKKPKILIIPTDEERMIARQTYALIA